jgi:hypothetical protein
MDKKEYLRKLRKVGTPDQFDKWFDSVCHCLLGKGGCEFCPSYLSSPRPYIKSRCGRQLDLFDGKNPFCNAFKTCDECGIGCGRMPEFEWVQAMLDKCIEAGLFECPGADHCWKGDDCRTCTFVPCRECRLFQPHSDVCAAGWDQIPWDCPYVSKAE